MKNLFVLLLIFMMVLSSSCSDDDIDQCEVLSTRVENHEFREARQYTCDAQGKPSFVVVKPTLVFNAQRKLVELKIVSVDGDELLDAVYDVDCAVAEKTVYSLHLFNEGGSQVGAIADHDNLFLTLRAGASAICPFSNFEIY